MLAIAFCVKEMLIITCNIVFLIHLVLILIQTSNSSHPVELSNVSICFFLEERLYLTIYRVTLLFYLLKHFFYNKI